MSDGSDCTSYCKCKEHGNVLASVIQCQHLNDTEVVSYLSWKCCNYCALVDSGGRPLTHVAASTGRLDLLRHFLQNYDGLNKVDEESGYSLLHSSLYHGQIHCAIRLIQLGANLTTMDNEFLAPFEIVTKDTFNYNRKSSKTSNVEKEAFVWGINANYNLGIGHNRERVHPDSQEFFRRKSIVLKQVAMQKFHSIYVTDDGQAWSCGNGPGGRLGQGTEAPALEPKPMTIPSSLDCIAAAVAEDHSILLMSAGIVFTCGLNSYYQLGVTPPPVQLLTPKPVRNLCNVKFIAAAQFHSVFCSTKQVYVCGLNAGQLGIPCASSGQNKFECPKEVVALKLKDAEIVGIAACAAATVILSSAGAVYSFHNYRCERLTPRDWLRLGSKVEVTGGYLDSKVLPGNYECTELKVGLLANNFFFLWRSSGGGFLQCLYSVKRELMISDIAFFGSGCLFTTLEGEGFLGYFRDGKKNKTVEVLDVRRLVHIHRSEAVAADPVGRNFAILQSTPAILIKPEWYDATRGIHTDLEALLDEAHIDDDLHDVVFEVNGRLFPAHSYIVFHARESATMKKLLSEDSKDDLACPKRYKLPEITIDAFQDVLRFVYSGKLEGDEQQSSRPTQCIQQSGNVIKGKKNYKSSNLSMENTKRSGIANEEEEEGNEDDETISAFESYHNKKDKGGKKREIIHVPGFKSAAKKLGIAALSGKKTTPLPSRLDRKGGKFDVKLVSADGSIIHVHKCILVARLEYFRVMLTHGWREAREFELRVPVTGRVLEALVDFMYTDESRDVMECEDIDFLATVLVASDELLCEGLRLHVENKLVHLLNLRNAVDFLQLAATYNAKLVENAAKHFIVSNLAAFLELRSLQVLSDETLMELSSLYRERISPYRRLGSSLDDLEIVTIKSIAEAYPTVLDLVGELAKPQEKGKTPTPRKKERRERKTSERQRLVSVDSCEEAIVSPISSPLNKDENKVKADDGWVEVDQSKTSKLVQSRLKAIAESLQATPIYQSTVLTKREPEVVDKKDLIVSLERDFPQLNFTRSDKTANNEGTSPKSSPADLPKKFTKLSQRERRRLASQSTPTEEIQVPQQKSPWAIIHPPQIFDNDVQSPPSESQLSVIIDSEQKERERLERLRNKPLALTQLEDRAIHDLMIFYNTAGATDEKITVYRLASGSVAAPMWVTGHR